mmetsp:Transcript_15787/g.37227  ORF Transcript_15787/g.37227 Transcript_15787/m.37227 type:complete len:246 (-) Transcript_15787:448-1185(-)
MRGHIILQNLFADLAPLLSMSNCCLHQYYPWMVRERSTKLFEFLLGNIHLLRLKQQQDLVACNLHRLSAGLLVLQTLLRSYIDALQAVEERLAFRAQGDQVVVCHSKNGRINLVCVVWLLSQDFVIRVFGFIILTKPLHNARLLHSDCRKLCVILKCCSIFLRHLLSLEKLFRAKLFGLCQFVLSLFQTTFIDQRAGGIKAQFIGRFQGFLVSGNQVHGLSRLLTGHVRGHSIHYQPMVLGVLAM